MNENTNPGEEVKVHPDYANQVVAVIRSNLTPKYMSQQIADFHENDIAQALDQMTKAERAKLYSLLDRNTLADVISYAENRQIYLGELGIRKRVEVLSQLDPAEAVEYLQPLPKQDRNVLLDLMDDEIRREILLLSSFHEDEIGGKMTTNYVAIPAGIGIRQAMGELVSQAADNDNISTIYVVDTDGCLVGAIDLKDLIIAREGTALDSITMSSYPYVYADEQIDDCIERLKDYSEDSIPVLDEDNRLIGVLIAQDITHMVDDAMGDDYAKLAGLIAEEDLNEPLKKSISKRLPWLIILLGLG